MKSNPLLGVGTKTKGSVEASRGLPVEDVPAVWDEYPDEFLHTVPDPPSQAIDMPELHHTAPLNVPLPLSVQMGTLFAPPGEEGEVGVAVRGTSWQVWVSA